MEQYKDDRIDPIAEYRADIKSLLSYLPWLDANREKKLVAEYQGDADHQQSFTFPVYDSTLLGFVKAVKNTKLIDRNYPYVYSRNQIHGVEDELKIIQTVRRKDIHILKGILSYYVIGGQTKGNLWPQAVSSGVFYEVLSKLQEFISIG